MYPTLMIKPTSHEGLKYISDSNYIENRKLSVREDSRSISSNLSNDNCLKLK